MPKAHHGSVFRVVKSLQQLYERGLATAAGADEGDALARRDEEGETTQHLHFPPSRVAELYVLVLNLPLCDLE